MRRNQGRHRIGAVVQDQELAIRQILPLEYRIACGTSAANRTP